MLCGRTERDSSWNVRESEDDVNRGNTRRGMKTKSGEAGGGRVSRPQGHVKNHGLWPESNGKPVKGSKQI